MQRYTVVWARRSPDEIHDIRKARRQSTEQEELEGEEEGYMSRREEEQEDLLVRGEAAGRISTSPVAAGVVNADDEIPS